MTNLKQSTLERPFVLPGLTYKVRSNQGTAFITINGDSDGNPVEVFVNVGKAGSDIGALSESIGRVISSWVRTSKDRKESIEEIIEQLKGIGGTGPKFNGRGFAASIPDALAKVLTEFTSSQTDHPDSKTI